MKFTLRTAIGLAAAAASPLLLPQVAIAQVVVIADNDTGGCVYRYHRRDTYSAAASDALRRLGRYHYTLLATSRAGYGSVFAAKDPGSGKTRFFTAYGYSTSEEAIIAARTKANNYIRQLGRFSTSYICANWNNRNEFSLDTYPVES